jgi:hypothetical protein
MFAAFQQSFSGHFKKGGLLHDGHAQAFFNGKSTFEIFIICPL